MASKDTGFHSSDADWTRGRATAVADAESLARRQISMRREVALRELARIGQEFDADGVEMGGWSRLCRGFSRYAAGAA
jgi:hypothetical protein